MTALDKIALNGTPGMSSDVDMEHDVAVLLGTVPSRGTSNLKVTILQDIETWDKLWAL